MTRRILHSEHSRHRRRLYDQNLRRRHPVLRTNLNEIAQDDWATRREYELRAGRYELWRGGGLIGAMQRFGDIMRGDPDHHGHFMDVRVFDDPDAPTYPNGLFAHWREIEDQL